MQNRGRFREDLDPVDGVTLPPVEPTRHDPIDDIAAGRAVLETESAALTALSDALDDLFVAAVDLLGSGHGRVIVTGMGKSGHVAHKIAATFASTGTPAIFVHPAEASHGDLGMVTRSDVVLALSNSGETAELNDIVEHAGRFRIPLVAIVGRAGSTLAEQADIALVLPDAPEACPNRMAPTTSTTMAMALGDALAVALMRRAGFTGIDFKMLHPGGSLGSRLRTVADLMHKGDDVPLIGADRGMDEALIEMTARSFGCVGVIDANGALMGIVTDGDLRRHMGAGLLAKKVTDIMTTDPKVVASRRLAAEALWTMSTNSISSLFVVDDGRPVGILHLHDCLRAGIA
jgi:arabinose-5-phosphate isomerase